MAKRKRNSRFTVGRWYVKGRQEYSGAVLRQKGEVNRLDGLGVRRGPQGFPGNLTFPVSHCCLIIILSPFRLTFTTFSLPHLCYSTKNDK